MEDLARGAHERGAAGVARAQVHRALTHGEGEALLLALVVVLQVVPVAAAVAVDQGRRARPGRLRGHAGRLRHVAGHGLREPHQRDVRFTRRLREGARGVHVELLAAVDHELAEAAVVEGLILDAVRRREHDVRPDQRARAGRAVHRHQADLGVLVRELAVDELLGAAGARAGGPGLGRLHGRGAGAGHQGQAQGGQGEAARGHGLSDGRDAFGHTLRKIRTRPEAPLSGRNCALRVPFGRWRAVHTGSSRSQSLGAAA